MADNPQYLPPGSTTVVTPAGEGGASPPADTSLTALVSGIVSDAQTLIRQEMALAKVEIKNELTKTRDAAISFAAGAGALIWAVVMLAFGAVHLISWAADIPLWAAYGIVGGLFLLAGLILLYIGKTRAESINLVPRQTVETMQENVQWIKNQK